MRLHDLVAPPVRLRLRGVIDHATEKLALRGAIATAHRSASPRGSCCDSSAP